jgi:glucose-1-phosphate adenylyltransferase
MDYSAMLDYHKKMNAAATIAVIDVPIEQASRFGIMNTEEDGRIFEFEEKPANPKSTKASMGIYIFNKKLLAEYLTADENDPNSSKDFGKKIIPAMLANGESMYAYQFSGYWKDVGTIQSLWEANMDLLGENPIFNLQDADWKIYSRSQNRAPHYIGRDAKVDNSIITEGCEIHGVVENSVLFGGVRVARGAYIRNAIIMNDTVVKEGASVYYSIVDGDTEIGAGAQIGEERESGKGITLVGSDLVIPPATVIPAGDMVNAAYLDEKKKN